MIMNPKAQRSSGNLPTPGILILLLVLLWGCAAGTQGEQSRPPENIFKEEALRLGERMYREGILPSGKPMQAVVKGDTPVTGTAFTCASCHLRSGLGSFEGGVATPPTNGRNLFKPRNMIYMGVEVTSAPPVRPAYTDESLARVLRTGIDPSGRILDEAMPRYALRNEDMALLITYLKSLSSQFSPGVSETTVRFATVITDDVSAEDRAAMLAPLQQYMRSADNRADDDKTHAEQDRTGESAALPHETGYKRPLLSRWLLKGPPDTWRGQLEDYYRNEPVFALLGGITKGTWQPIHEFSEDNHMPCILPVTDFPVISETDWYTLYFSKGLYQEGESAARYLDGQGTSHSLVQIVRESQEGLALSAGFLKTWEDLGHKAPVTLTLKREETLTRDAVQHLLRAEKPDVLIVWDGPGFLPALQALPIGENRPAMVFVSLSYLGQGVRTIDDALRDVVYLTYPYRLPHDRARSAVELPFTENGTVQQDQLIIAKKMYTAIKVLSQALIDMKGQYYRDNLLDVFGMSRDAMGMGAKAEDETYPLYERLSFGPGQRYASKGCFIVQLTQGPRPELIRKSDWVRY